MNKKNTLQKIYINSLILYFLCLPLNAMNIGSMGSALKLIALLPVGICLLKGKIKLKLHTPELYQLLFTLFALCSLLWTVNIGMTKERVTSYVLLYVLLFSTSNFNYSEQDIYKLKKSLVWSSRITAIILLLFADYAQGRMKLTGLINEDPNYLCAYFIFGTIYAIDTLTKRNNTSNKIIAVLELILYSYLIFKTGSRGGLIAIVSSILVFMLTSNEKSNNKLSLKLSIIILISIIAIIIINNLPDDIKLRYSIDDVEASGGSGRTTIWKNALDLFRRSSIFQHFFGHGTATVRWCFSRYNYSNSHVVHNMFLETLVELGIIGLTLYIATIFNFAKKAASFVDKFALAVIMGMIVMSLSTSISVFKPYFNIMMYIVITENIKLTERASNELKYSNSCI